MERKAIFVMSGAAHLPYLVTALSSLRRYWSGKVHLYAWEESHKICKLISKDFDRLYIEEVHFREPPYRGKNSQFEDKQRVMMGQPMNSVNLYLDADLLFAGNVSHLLNLAEDHGFVATQFNAWKTNGGVVRKRIERLRQFPDIPQASVEKVMEESYPSVNGGVFACRPTSEILAEWLRRTEIARDIFISDETALHTFLPEGLKVATSGMWNSSTKEKYLSNELPGREAVRIWHGHGDSFVRADKSPTGYAMWAREFQRCVKHNIGNVNDWIEEVYDIPIYRGVTWKNVISNLPTGEPTHGA